MSVRPIGGGRVARPKASPAAPHPACPFCADESRACLFHRATDPAALVRALSAALRRDALVGLADYFDAALSAVVVLPAPVRAALETAEASELVAEWEELVDLDPPTPEDFRRLAAVSLALAVVQGEGATEDDDASDDVTDAEVIDDGT